MGFPPGITDRRPLEPDFSTADGVAHCTQDPQHDADHHEDAADGVQDGEASEVADQKKNDAEHNHGQSNLIREKYVLVAQRNCQIRQFQTFRKRPIDACMKPSPGRGPSSWLVWLFGTRRFDRLSWVTRRIDEAVDKFGNFVGSFHVGEVTDAGEHFKPTTRLCFM